ncbi:MAG: glycosyltransferase [Bacteroidota bacterium]
MMLKGGPRTQILQTKVELENLGVKVALFDSWQEFKKGEFDLVHIFSAGIGTYHLARMLKLNGVPTVVTPIFYTRHSGAFVRMAIAGDRSLRKFLPGFWTDYGIMAEICQWAKAVFPTTQAEATLFSNGFGVSKESLTVVPVGIEKRFYSAKPGLFKKKYGTENFVLNVGHVGPARKNVFRLLRALESVEIPAVIIGRIEQSEAGRACMEQAKRNPRLTVLESIPHDSPLLASAYAAAKVFALPSIFETPGIAALEAGLAGANIVITPNGGTRDYFGSDAEYVDPNYVEDIRGGIVRALEKDRGTGLREKFKNEFSWKNAAIKLRDAYRKALESQ